MISVIIPSHNRKILLRKTLDALSRQTFPADQFEVIVVLDGCQDGTRGMLNEYSAQYCLLIIEQEQSGPAAARNLGAKHATGDLLIFIDDDIEPIPEFIQAHLNAHKGSSPLVVIGYSPPAMKGEHSYFAIELMGWWEKMFEDMYQPGYRFRFSDMLSGNFSIPSDIFTHIGGFNDEFTVHEDYELGVRLIHAGIGFVFEQNALGIHHEQSDLRRSLSRKYFEGIADIKLGRLYPELIPNLAIWNLIHYSAIPSKVLRIMTFVFPRLADWIVTKAQNTLPAFEYTGLLPLWRRVLYGIMGYWYWKGVSLELDTLNEVYDFVIRHSTSTPSHDLVETELDLSHGLEEAEQNLASLRPDCVRLYYGQKIVGTIFAQLGAERLNAVHLRPFLKNTLSEYLADKASVIFSKPPISIEEILVLMKDNILTIRTNRTGK